MLATIAAWAACAAPPRGAWQRFEYARLAMGVEARIVLFAPDESAAVRAADAAFARIAELERSFSDWREDSELMRLCARAGEGPVAVSEDLFEVLALAQRVAAASDGAFDVTVGPLVGLWREARRRGVLPDADGTACARRLVGARLLSLDSRRRTAALALPGMRLDLGGIGKGWACDAALARLGQDGIERALVQMGGDVACGAPPPDAPGWEVDVGGERLIVARCGIATSGDAEQHVEIGGVRYAHVVDPRTGVGLTTGLEVTVRAPSAATADALATAAGVLGAEGAEPMLAAFRARLLRAWRVRAAAPAGSG